MAETLTLPPKDEAPKVALDLDQTLFDTWAFMNDAAQTMVNHFGRTHGVTEQTFSKEAVLAEYGDSGNGLRYYPFSRHLGKLGIALDAAKQHILEDLRGNNYLYAGAGPLLNFLDERRALGEISGIGIVTHGEDFSQEVKRRLSPRLEKYPWVITLSSKGPHLDGAIIIDDKPIGDLPPDAVQALIDRSPSPAKGSYSNLTSVQQEWPIILSRSHAARQKIT